MGTLVACGNSICGNSAIAAVAPVIGADGDEVAASIAFTAVLGVAAVVGLPFLGAALHMSGPQFGALAGLTVYAVPQVLAATSPMGSVAVRFGTLVRLIRVLMLWPVCFGLSLILARRSKTPGGAQPPIATGGRQAMRRPGPARLAPWFILGFLALACARTLDWVPTQILPTLGGAASVLTVISTAALGLGTDARMVARSGPRVSAAVVLSLASLGIVDFGLIASLRLR